jgi:hypothetical protein
MEKKDEEGGRVTSYRLQVPGEKHSAYAVFKALKLVT